MSVKPILSCLHVKSMLPSKLREALGGSLERHILARHDLALVLGHPHLPMAGTCPPRSGKWMPG